MTRRAPVHYEQTVRALPRVVVIVQRHLVQVEVLVGVHRFAHEVDDSEVLELADKHALVGAVRQVLDVAAQVEFESKT